MLLSLFELSAKAFVSWILSFSFKYPGGPSVSLERRKVSSTSYSGTPRWRKEKEAQSSCQQKRVRNEGGPKISRSQEHLGFGCLGPLFQTWNIPQLAKHCPLSGCLLHTAVLTAECLQGSSVRLPWKFCYSSAPAVAEIQPRRGPASYSESQVYSQPVMTRILDLCCCMKCCSSNELTDLCPMSVFPSEFWSLLRH